MSDVNKLKLYHGNQKKTPKTSRIHVADLIKRMLDKHSDKISSNIKKSAIEFNRTNSRKGSRGKYLKRKQSVVTSPIFTSKMKPSNFGSGVYNQISQRIKFRNFNTIEWKIGTDPLFPGSLVTDTQEDENIIQQYDKVFSSAVENIKNFANKELYSSSIKLNSNTESKSSTSYKLLEGNDKESKYLNNQFKKLSRNQDKAKKDSFSRIYRTVM